MIIPIIARPKQYNNLPRIAPTIAPHIGVEILSQNPRRIGLIIINAGTRVIAYSTQQYFDAAKPDFAILPVGQVLQWQPDSDKLTAPANTIYAVTLDAVSAAGNDVRVIETILVDEGQIAQFL